MNGRIHIYRVFDIGKDVNLEGVQRTFEMSSSAQRFRLNRTSKAMIINQPPLSLAIENSKYNALGHPLDLEVTAKIWHFGAVSLTLSFVIPKGLSWDKLIALGNFLENDSNLHDLAKKRIEQIVAGLGRPVSSVTWETYEDYACYFFQSLEGCEKNAMEVFNRYDVFRLILSENNETLSDQIKKTILESTFQYSQDDLAVIDWNSALIIEPSGSTDIVDVIEFSLCQLLEMRYYDDLLDERLTYLYSSLEKKRFSIFQNHYSRLSREAAQIYLDISDTVESVENTMKVVGDFYLAKIFRAASQRLRFKDWRDSVDQKLSNLAQVSRLFVGEANEKRNQLLEIIIIFLIAIEVVPLFFK
ncbi:MAG: hypothetical protein OM95_05960 [Bdellovibrio sp. ArHS]|uniref:hypothetical protein n=1 Tax=Bdellovibrio sp. ArHS TaxID=1569284 RepID=UPI00058378E7|nr:hypothetical protein [Bdellovibrio sp. ArHS]KHD89003.1 MAG: hypothetical protein OM95_05960 [Bdellovibrio sp. ArHS]